MSTQPTSYYPQLNPLQQQQQQIFTDYSGETQSTVYPSPMPSRNLFASPDKQQGFISQQSSAPRGLLQDVSRCKCFTCCNLSPYYVIGIAIFIIGVLGANNVIAFTHGTSVGFMVAGACFIIFKAIQNLRNDIKERMIYRTN